MSDSPPQRALWSPVMRLQPAGCLLQAAARSAVASRVSALAERCAEQSRAEQRRDSDYQRRSSQDVTVNIALHRRRRRSTAPSNSRSSPGSRPRQSLHFAAIVRDFSLFLFSSFFYNIHLFCFCERPLWQLSSHPGHNALSPLLPETGGAADQSFLFIYFFLSRTVSI